MNPKIRSVELNEYLELVRFIFFLVHNLTCIPGYLERFNLIISLKDSEASKAFLIHLLDRLRYILVRTIPYFVNRIIFYGDVSQIQEKFDEFSSKMKSYCEISHFSDAAINAIPIPGMPKITDVIDETQLEKKYGGDRPNIEEYWPPTHHTTPGESIDDEDLGKLRLIPFFIYEEDFTNFVQEHIPKNDISIDKRGHPNAVHFKAKPGQGINFITGAKSTSETLTKGGDEARIRLRKANQRTHTVSPDKKPSPGPGEDNFDTETKENYSPEPGKVIGPHLHTEIDTHSKAASFHAGHISKHRQSRDKPKGVSGFFKMLGCCGDR